MILNAKGEDPEKRASRLECRGSAAVGQISPEDIYTENSSLS